MINTPVPTALLNNTICHILSQPFCNMSHDICDKLKYKMPNVQVGMTQNMSNSAQDQMGCKQSHCMKVPQ